MQNAALYIRVSTEDQTEFSPDAQKRLLLEYAQKNNIAVNQEHIFVDEGISGRKAEKRPGFMKMIATAKKKPKPFDFILIHRFDRFSRSREDSIVYKSLLKKECDIKVISITEQLEDDKFSVILEAMLEAMAEYYSLNLADEVTKGMTEKALRGGFQASPPLGYKIMHAGELPVIVPEEAFVVKLIFEKYVYDNMSFYEIAKYLNIFGYKTKQKKDFERRSVEYILKNPINKGIIRWNRTHSATKTVKDTSRWIIAKGEHEPVISEELYDLAQKKLHQENTGAKARPVTEYKHWLSGMVKCSCCGRSMTASRMKDSQYYRFSCNGYSKGKCPVCNSITEKKLIPCILETLEKVIITENKVYIKSAKSTGLTESDLLDEGILLKQQLTRLKEKENRVKIAYINGVDTLEEYEENKAALTKENKLLREQIQKYNGNHIKDGDDIKDEDHIKDGNHIKDGDDINTGKLQQIDHLESVYEIITSDTIDNRTKNQALKTIIDKIIYDKKEGRLDIYFKYHTLLQ